MTFEPQNDLERALIKAAADPAQQPQFYRALAAATVFVVPHETPPQQGRTTISQGTQLRLRSMEHEGKPCIPFFSSLARLQAVASRETPYMALNARQLMQVVRGTTLLLNPGAQYGKEITPEEAAGIADGSILKSGEPYVAPKNTQVMIGQPKNYPAELVGALTRLFRTRPEVKRAWLAHFFNPDRDRAPHTLIAVESTGDVEALCAEAGVVAQSVKIPDPPVDFLPITGRGGVENYFLEQTQPFYVRAAS